MAPYRMELVAVWKALYARQLAHSEVANAAIRETKCVAPAPRAMQACAKRACKRVETICNVSLVLASTSFQSVTIHAIRLAQVTECLPKCNKVERLRWLHTALRAMPCEETTPAILR